MRSSASGVPLVSPSVRVNRHGSISVTQIAAVPAALKEAAAAVPSVVEDAPRRGALDAAAIVLDAVEQLAIAQEALRQMTLALVDSRSEASAAAERATRLDADLTEARGDVARARVIEEENSKLRAECTKLSSELATARSESEGVAKELAQLQSYTRTLEQIAYEEVKQQSAPEQKQSVVHVSRHGSVSISPAAVPPPAGVEAHVEEDLADLRDLFQS